MAIYAMIDYSEIRWYQDQKEHIYVYYSVRGSDYDSEKMSKRFRILTSVHNKYFTCENVEYSILEFTIRSLGDLLYSKQNKT